MKWYGVELSPEIAVEFRQFLIDKRFSYLLPGGYIQEPCYESVRFEVFLEESDLHECNEFIDTLVKGDEWNGN